MDSMTRVEALLEEALALPPKDRVRLVEELTLSLDGADEDDDLDDETRALIERRVDDMIAHPERAKPADEVMADLRKSLDDFRRSRS